MTRFCTHCGSETSPGAQFCTICGAVLPTEVLASPDADQPTIAASAPTTPLTAPRPSSPEATTTLKPSEPAALSTPGLTRTRGPVIALAALALAVAAGAAWVTKQLRDAPNPPSPTVEAQGPADASAAPDAPGQTPQTGSTGRPQTAPAAPDAGAPAPPEVEAPTAPDVELPAAPVGVDLDGSAWSGAMYGGKYRFRLEMTVSPGGRVDARMYQISTASGNDGTEVLTGEQDGSRVYLQGDYWEGAPSAWELDTVRFKVTRGGRLSGSYTCASCGGWLDLTGSRDY